MTTSVGKKRSGSKKKTTDKPKVSATSPVLETATWSDILPILRQNYEPWHAGLTRERYCQWVWHQMIDPWCRRNFRYLVWRVKGEIVSSCKLYTMQFGARGSQYKVAGVGAVFTAPQHRGTGHAARMLKAVESLAREEQYDALLLYSEIDPAYYEALGYEQMSDWQFHIWLSDPEVEAGIMSDPHFFEDMQEHEPELATVELCEIDNLSAHHRRYLVRQPFGIQRSDLYWSYKITRGKFLETHSRLNWPALELMLLDGDAAKGGYVMFEQGGKILRVLEVAGSEATQAILWRHLLRTALLRRIQLVRGWESCAPRFVKRLQYAQREWGRPMMLCINPQLEGWLDLPSCPLLEFDHF